MSAGLLVPLHVFRFQVDFVTEDLSSGAASGPSPCRPLSRSAGTRGDDGAENVQGRRHELRGGPARRSDDFATVILKRGISANADLWNIFNGAATGLYAPRMQVTISVFDIDGSAGVAWQLDRAMPVKYKFADLNARGGGEVGIEELHLVHEGLWTTTASALGSVGT